MEYCEKSTLRDTIDQGLYQDQNRLWRLFREILDGLAYIHQQVSDYTHLKTCHTKVLKDVFIHPNYLICVSGYDS